MTKFIIKAYRHKYYVMINTMVSSGVLLILHGYCFF
jgi:hypothetical protein